MTLEQFILRYYKWVWKQAHSIAFQYGIKDYAEDIAQSGFEGMIIGYRKCRKPNITFINLYVRKYMVMEAKKIKNVDILPQWFDMDDGGEEVSFNQTRIDLSEQFTI